MKILMTGIACSFGLLFFVGPASAQQINDGFYCEVTKFGTATAQISNSKIDRYRYYSGQQGCDSSGSAYKPQSVNVAVEEGGSGFIDGMTWSAIDIADDGNSFSLTAKLNGDTWGMNMKRQDD